MLMITSRLEDPNWTCEMESNQQESGIMRSGTVEGKYVKNILLDTGCSMTLVHQKLVSEEEFLEGKATNGVLCTWRHSVVSLGKGAHGSRGKSNRS